MTLLVMVVALAVAAGPGAAQTRRPTSNWAPQSTFATPQSPKPPASPTSPAFKPYHPTSSYSDRGGVDAYPSAQKPRSTTTSLYGPDSKPRR